MVRQKVRKSYFQNQFSMTKIDIIFSKKNLLRILGNHCILKIRDVPVLQKLGIADF